MIGMGLRLVLVAPPTPVTCTAVGRSDAAHPVV